MPDLGERFERDHGCTPAEWLRWLPEAAHGHALAISGNSARIAIGDGALRIAWHELPARQIALIRLPRLHVAYAFEGVDAPARLRFMHLFDLHIQRGGG